MDRFHKWARTASANTCLIQCIENKIKLENSKRNSHEWLAIETRNRRQFLRARHCVECSSIECNGRSNWLAFYFYFSICGYVEHGRRRHVDMCVANAEYFLRIWKHGGAAPINFYCPITHKSKDGRWRRTAMNMQKIVPMNGDEKKKTKNICKFAEQWIGWIDGRRVWKMTSK